MQLNIFFAVRFYAVCAEVVVRRIVRLNGGSWPRTLSQWQGVAGKLRYVLLIVAGEPSVRSCCLFRERVILIRFEPDERLMLRDVCHEIAHAIIAASGPVGWLLDWPHDDEDAHLVARIVEEHVDLAMIEDSQQVLFGK